MVMEPLTLAANTGAVILAAVSAAAIRKRFILVLLLTVNIALSICYQACLVKQKLGLEPAGTKTGLCKHALRPVCRVLP